MHDHHSKAREKAQALFLKVAHLSECFQSLKSCEEKLEKLNLDIYNAEQKLDETEEKALNQIRCISIILLKVIEQYAPNAAILETFANLLEKGEQFCEDFDDTTTTL